MRLIMSGTFDRFPKFKIVLGHMGEACRSGFSASTAAI